MPRKRRYLDEVEIPKEANQVVKDQFTVNGVTYGTIPSHYTKGKIANSKTKNDIASDRVYVRQGDDGEWYQTRMDKDANNINYYLDNKALIDRSNEIIESQSKQGIGHKIEVDKADARARQQWFSNEDATKFLLTTAGLGALGGGLVSAPLTTTLGLAGGYGGGKLVDKGMQKVTGQNWAQWMNNKTGLPEWVSEFTNPGGIIGFGVGSKIAKPIIGLYNNIRLANAVRKLKNKDNIANYNVFMTDAYDRYPYIIPNYTDNIENLKSIANYQGNHMNLTKQRLNDGGGYMQLQFLQDAKDRQLLDDDVWQVTTAYGIHPTERFPYDDYNINRLNNLKATIIDDPTQPDAFFDIKKQKIFRQRNPKRKDLFDTPHKVDIADSHEFAHAVIPMPEFNISPHAFNASRASYLGRGNNMEVAARGTQLKNYFGLDYAGDGFGPKDRFTEDMLKYAAKHYVKDTGIDNNMTEMFSKIRDWKEVADWINSNSPAIVPITLGGGSLFKLRKNKNKIKNN